VDAVRWFGVLGTGLYIFCAIAAVIWGLVEVVPGLVPTASGSAAAESDLLFAVALAGALGGLIHSARSFYWYVGNRELRRSWLMMYYLRPLAGAALAAVFYLVIRGGFIPDSESGNTLAFVALAALVGLFSEEAVLKLKEVAENIFKKTPQGKDAEPQVKPADDVAAEDGR
jgi:hypothetical protein